MQRDDDSLNDEALKVLCTDQEEHGGYFFFFNTRGRCAEHDLNWASGPGLVQSFDDPGEEIHLHYEVCQTGLQKQQLNRLLLDSNEQVRHDAAMERFFTTWPTQLTGSLAKVSRQKAEQLN